MGQLIKWGVILLAGILVYNYFFGTDAEKERSSKVFGEVSGLVRSVKDVVKAERQEFDAGKYNTAIDKLSGVIGKLKQEARASGDDAALRSAEALEQQSEALSSKVEAAEATSDKSSTKLQQAMKIKKDMDDLISRTEALAKNMEE